MYQFSLDGFMTVFKKAISRAAASDDVHERVANITDNVTYSLFCYASRGLFARHKMIFSSQLCCRIMASNGDLNFPAFDFLLRLPKVVTEKPEELHWLTDGAWYAANALKKLDGFEKSSFLR